MGREEVFRNERPSLGRGVRVFGAPLGETSNSKKFRERTGSICWGSTRLSGFYPKEMK